MNLRKLLFILFISSFSCLFYTVHAAQSAEVKQGADAVQADPEPSVPAITVAPDVVWAEQAQAIAAQEAQPAQERPLAESQSEVGKLQKEDDQLHAPERRRELFNRAHWYGLYMGARIAIQDIMHNKRVVLAATAIAGLLVYRNWSQIKQLAWRLAIR